MAATNDVGNPRGHGVFGSHPYLLVLLFVAVNLTHYRFSCFKNAYTHHSSNTNDLYNILQKELATTIRLVRRETPLPLS